MALRVLVFLAAALGFGCAFGRALALVAVLTEVFGAAETTALDRRRGGIASEVLFA